MPGPETKNLSPRIVDPPVRSQRVLVLGATGTIGSATVRSLVRLGHEVVCFLRPPADIGKTEGREALTDLLNGAELRFGHVTDKDSFTLEGVRGEHFDVLVSCLASRTGAPRDSWLIDYQAHVQALDVARNAGVQHFILLSAICVQKPVLAFQHAKLAFEERLKNSGLRYSIVRPTAYFKSLSGQINRLKQGKPFLMFGNGSGTACKPIGSNDLGQYLAECIDDESRHNMILPIGGPGKAITPREQGAYLFELLDLEPRFRQVPLKLLDTIVFTLGVLGRAIPPMADKAEMSRIARYYATESMLVLDPSTGKYDAAATPSYGKETLFDYYEQLVTEKISNELGDHAIF